MSERLYRIGEFVTYREGRPFSVTYRVLRNGKPYGRVFSLGSYASVEEAEARIREHKEEKEGAK